ncbi:paraneoplastic antigen-like protein 8B [Microcebus murinus]|uniref:paraneoplastic antigen-like protein 8B n=1 Tax=Microcebus murinus TaxID=30608 RepID=UPI000642F83D|nr:PNMA-like protein 2 [Microcebus murinus]
MAMSLLQDWCRELKVDVRRALLVTGIPEGLEQADIEAVLQPTFLPLGTFKLRNVRAVRSEKARAALLEFAEDIDRAAVPREIPGKDGVWRVLCKKPAQDTRFLRQMRRLLLDERPAQVALSKALGDKPTAPASETQAQGSGQAAGKAGAPSGAGRSARRGRRGRRNRARSNRLAQKGRKRGRGGRPSTPAESESDDSSDDSLGFVIREIEEGDLTGDQDQSALYAALQGAAKELAKKWALQSPAGEEDSTREFLALVTVADKTKKEKTEKETPGAESVRLNTKQEGSDVPDLVALLAVRDAPDEELMDSDASETTSQDSEEQENEMDNPEFVAIVAYTDPSIPSAREEMLKIASVIESLGLSDKKDKKDALPQILSVMSKDTSGTRVRVKEAGLEVDAIILRKAEDDGNLLECISSLADPDIPFPGKKAQGGLLGGWGGDGEEECGLLELVALLAAQDMADGLTAEEKQKAWEGAQFPYAEGKLGEVLALLAAREESGEASDEESQEESEDAESEESEPEDPASRKPRAKRARTGPRGPAQAGAGPAAAPAPAPPKARATRGGGQAVAQEKKAASRAEAKAEAAGGKKKKGSAGAGANAKAGDAKGQPPAGSKSARGRKARRGQKLPPRCR